MRFVAILFQADDLGLHGIYYIGLNRWNIGTSDYWGVVGVREI